MIRILIIYFLLFVASPMQLFAQCNRNADSLELVMLYNSTSGPNWLIKWDLIMPMERWYGISLTPEGCVVNIRLYQNGLQGKLPDMNLPFLEGLNLQFNSLDGPLPRFTFTKNIGEVRLDANNFSEPIPDFQLPNLTHLGLSNNKLSGSIPDFTGMQKLGKMWLERNQLSGQIPNFSNFPLLDNLYLFNNRLTGLIPDFSNLPNVSYIKLENNLLIGAIPDFKNLPNLYSLDLSGNLLTGTIPDFSNPKLSDINLSGNQLTDSIPFFSKLNSLQSLNLSNNYLYGRINSIPLNLKSLILANNRLVGEIPNFENQTRLEFIDLSFNQLSGVVPDLKNIENLISLNLSHNKLSGDLFEFTNGHPKLQVINLNSNQLSGTIPTYENSPALVDLNLSNNKIEGNLPDFTSTSLWDIDVSNNQLEGMLPQFDNLPNLRILKISSNGFYGKIPDFLWRSNFLRLYAVDNKFTFSDLLPVNPDLQVFEVGAQKPFYNDTIINGVADGELIIDLGIDDSIPNNNYNWYKENQSWSPPAGNDLHSNKLVFDNVKISDAGRYFVRVTNPDVQQGLLYSEEIGVKVCDAVNDSLELVSLYQSTNGDNWNFRDNWLNFGAPISKWFGITVSHLGCVQSIDLRGNNLSGTLPALNLNTLDTLILNDNAISGAIPELKIPFVKYLSLRNNNFVGSLPLTRLDWMNIKSLDLGQNNLVGSVPPDIGDLCDLVELKLDKNSFTGNLPEELTKLQNLEIGRVDFSNNRIDTLKEKIIFFCPFGDGILANNPSFDRFQSICNIKCDNFSWSDLQDSSWLIRILNQLKCSDISCHIISAEAGLVYVRGLKFIYTKASCCRDLECLDKEDIVTFYDCGGHIVEIASCTNGGGFCSTSGSISLETFHLLQFDPQWSCKHNINIGTEVVNKEKPEPFQIGKHTFNLSCFPVPVLDDLFCQLSEVNIDELTLINCLGMETKCNYLNNDGLIILSIADLPQGLYQLEVRVGLNRYIGKFIKG